MLIVGENKRTLGKIKTVNWVRNCDCMDTEYGLPSLPDECVQVCVTSPPYWSLRDYNVKPTVWGGEAACVHEWADFDCSTSKSIISIT